MIFLHNGGASHRIWERQIERAVNSIKRTAWDKWFRKEWYKAGARRKWSKKQRDRWAPGPMGGVQHGGD